MTRVAIVFVILVLLAGCGGKDGTSATPAKEASAPSAAPLSMTELCPKVASRLPRAEPGLNDAPWLAYWNYLTALGAKADADGRRALEALQVSVHDLGSNLSGIELLDARAAFRDALSRLDRKCIAAGSEALH